MRANSVIVRFLNVCGLVVSGVCVAEYGSVSTIVLKAASKHNGLGRRSDGVRLSRHAELPYVSDDSLGFVSVIRIRSADPFLLLEDIEHQLESITCHENSIKVQWNNDLSHQSKLTLEDTPGKRVEDVEFINDRTVHLSTRPRKWTEAPFGAEIGFGQISESYTARTYTDLGKRSRYPTDVARASSSTSPSPSLGNFSFAITDQMVSLGGPMRVGCKKCSIDGAITHLSTSSNGTQQQLQPGSGWVNLGMSLDAEFDFDFAFKTVNGRKLINLVPASVRLDFAVPLLATLSLIYMSNIEAEWNIGSNEHREAAQNFTYGFEMHIPKTSTIQINLFNRTKSVITGFDRAQFKTIPLQSGLANVEMDLKLSFQPTFQLDWNLLDGSTSGSAGFLFSLPELKLAAHQLLSSSVDAACKPLANNDTAGDGDGVKAGVRSAFRDAHKTLVHVVPAVQLALAFQDNVNVLGATVSGNLSGPTTVWKRTVEEPTACLAYDRLDAGFGYQPAAKLLARLAASASADVVGGAGLAPLLGLVLVVGWLVWL